MSEEKKQFDSIKYQNEYNANHYDRISVLLPKGEREELKQHARAQGMSANAWILQAIEFAKANGL